MSSPLRTPEQQVVDGINQQISQLPEDKQRSIKTYHTMLKKLTEDEDALMAMVLLGAEMAASE